MNDPQGAYPGPPAAGHTPVRFSDRIGDVCVKCRESWPCTVEDMRRTILALTREPLPEVACPSCGATIRARMADKREVCLPHPQAEALRDFFDRTGEHHGNEQLERAAQTLRVRSI